MKPRVPNLTRRLTVLAALLLCAGGGLRATAVEYAPRLHQSEWRSKGSVLECRLSQRIPYFGEASFVQRAGERSVFELSSVQHLPPGQAALRAEAPPWRGDAPAQRIAMVDVRPGTQPIQLGESLASEMLARLFQGLNLVFGELPAASPRSRTSVGLAAVNFRAAYGKWLDCVGGLLPAGYAEASRTRIGFEGGGFELDDAARRRLDLVLKHIELAGDVSGIFVDGYSDAAGRRSANLELSKKRAEAVSNYLLNHGIAKEKITLRYHGSRYPVARGFSAAARAQNRRVTVRLERG